VTDIASGTATTGTGRRLPGPDVVRAVALIGVVVMNYHGYLILRASAEPREGWLEELFDPWTGPLSTRFAATFVLVAGVGVSLMTASTVDRARSHPGDEIARRSLTTMRWRLVRRGVALYVFGLLLDEIWPGTIIPYYGLMFVLAAGLLTWRIRWVVAAGLGAALAGAALAWWRFERHADGASTQWLTQPDEGSLRDHVFGVTVNGTHPLLPWFAFFCAGIVLGRIVRTPWWRPAVVGVGLALVTIAAVGSTAATTERAAILLSINPFDRGVVYVASALGTALLAYAGIDWLADRYPAATDPLRRAGQMTLTLYVLHVLVFNLVVDWLGWIEPAGIDVALLFALGFWVLGIAVAVAWNRRFGTGPAERVYRALGG
jgi:uncharacterized membrane protein YeiB